VSFGECDAAIDYAVLRHGVKDIITLMSKSVVPKGESVRVRNIGEHCEAVKLRGFTRGFGSVGSGMFRYNTSVKCMRLIKNNGEQTIFFVVLTMK
jgi:hypothetical protein